MTPQEVLNAAKQGNPQAIAALMNRHLQPKGITAQVSTLGDSLHIVLEATQAPNQQALVGFITKGVQNLQITSVKKLTVYGKKSGEEKAAWTETVLLGAQPSPVNTTQEKTADSEVRANRTHLLVAGSVVGLLLVVALLNVTNPPKPAPPSQSQPSSVETGTTGIGVSRHTIQSLYERPDIGFSFDPPSTLQGQPRVLGKSPDNLAFIELTGSPENISKAYITVIFANTDRDFTAEKVKLLVRFIDVSAPEWIGGDQWVIDSIKSFSDGNVQKSTVHGSKTFRLEYTKELASISLTISD